MITVIDIETTVTGEESSPSPYLPDNDLVSVGYHCWWNATTGYDTNYLCFKHKVEPPTLEGKDSLQKVLDKTKLLIGQRSLRLLIQQQDTTLSLTYLGYLSVGLLTMVKYMTP